MSIDRLGPALALFALYACAGPTTRPSTQPSNETAFVSQIVKFVRDTSRTRVDVDPEPLPPSLEGPGAIPSASEVKQSGGYAEIRAMLSAATRAAPPAERDHCFGLVPDDSVGSQHSGCPKTPHVLLVIGRPRVDTVVARKLARGGPIDPNRRWVRVIETIFTPSGSNVTLCDYVFERIADAWTLARRVQVFSMD